MKVLFLKHVINVGKEGEIKEVKSGYAQNFLLPKKFAVELTAAEERKYKDRLKKKDSHRRELIENKHNLSEILNHKELAFALKTGANGKVFGGIGEKDIIGEIKKKFNIELTKKHIDLPAGHIKKIGESDVYINLGKDSMAKMKIILSSSNS
ncbi:50S ribosomal protein L9 [Candidatus Gracilibacteria bacterium 28_42_T64]|nr:50S ribosomal protein L9 [Candidatus Gracilibacteria bacterium 28_42_T64]